MNKRDFIQHAAIRLLDRKYPDVDKAVGWAERLWQRLSQRGYGARTEQGPREHMDWIARLTPEQRELFHRFWQAFGYKKGKQGAAMRWSQINPDEDLARHIIEAAAAEAQRKLPDGQSRKMAQGWLAERRWEDFEVSRDDAVTDDETTRRSEIARLNAELLHVEHLEQHTKDPNVKAQLREQIEDLKHRLTALENHE